MGTSPPVDEVLMISRAGTAFDSFADASRAAVEHLQAAHGMGLWMVTRTTGDDWIVLEAADSRYDVGPGALFRWSDSFCSRMVAGEGPAVAPDAAAVPAYAAAPIAGQVPIGAYVGVPLTLADGSLFGTLCAIDPHPHDERLAAAGCEAGLLGRMLSTLLSHELEADAQAQRAEAAEREAAVDALTGLPNRRAWDRALEAEEARCRRYGVSAAVCIVDLDSLKEANDDHGHAAGDELLRTTAAALTGAAREGDVVARVGGDEFGVLLLGCDQDEAATAAARFEHALELAGVAASAGAAPRSPAASLSAAVTAADKAMYARKLGRRAAVAT